MPRGPHLSLDILQGCCREAQRADLVSLDLQGLRDALPEALRPHLNGVIYELGHTARHLRDLADKAQVHLGRVPQAIDYLNVVLPCLTKTLLDITRYYEDTSLPRERRWRYMYHNMSSELPGTTLPARFIMYNQYLKSLRLLLARSPNFDINALESLKDRILQLRMARNIPPPAHISSMELIRQVDMREDWGELSDIHWAKTVFATPTPTRTKFRRSSIVYEGSEAYGPLKPLGILRPMLPDAKNLVERHFDGDRITVFFFLQGEDQAPFVYLRTYREENHEFWAAVLGAHELVLKRDGEAESALVFNRWSTTNQRSKAWARLQFKTWEELVLFHCTFIALKAQSPHLLKMDPHEHTLCGEKRLFQAHINDDGYKHSLAVYEDQATKGLRLHATVLDGELRGCPVWTAFLDPKLDMIRKCPHRVWLRDLQPYVFLPDYNAQNQRKGVADAFEIYFVKAEAAARFKRTFEPDPAEPANTTTESSDTATGGSDA